MAFELLLGQISGGHSLTGLSENEARKALVRLLSIDAPLDPRLREMLAGLFDPDPPGFKEPDDVSIQAAIEANDAFIERLEAIRNRAQGLMLPRSGDKTKAIEMVWTRPAA
jgi:hypothetical protein